MPPRRALDVALAPLGVTNLLFEPACDTNEITLPAVRVPVLLFASPPSRQAVLLHINAFACRFLLGDKRRRDRALSAHVSWFDRVCLTSHLPQQEEKLGARSVFLCIVELFNGHAELKDLGSAQEGPQCLPARSFIVLHSLWVCKPAASSCAFLCLILRVTSLVLGLRNFTSLLLR